jgi:heme A synthase
MTAQRRWNGTAMTLAIAALTLFGGATTASADGSSGDNARWETCYGDPAPKPCG